MNNRRNFLKCWTVPIVISITLPKHACASGPIDPVNREIKVSTVNAVCTEDSLPITASFTLCNDEMDIVVVEELDPTMNERIDTVEPSLPFAIPVGGCIGVKLLYKIDAGIGCQHSLGFSAHLESLAAVGWFNVNF